MHARHRSPGNGYRSSSVGMGGLAAGPRISAESSSRGRGMYNSQYRGYNRGFGRGQPKPSQPAAQPPVRRTDVFMEAGRLATVYLISKGLLHPNVFSGKCQNGSLKNQLGDFQGFKQQEGDSLPLPPEGRTSALSRLGNAAADARGSGRRRFSPDEYNSTGSRSFMRGRRRMGTFKNYGSDWGRDMGRSGSWSEKARASPDMEGGDDYFSAYQEEQQVSNDVGSGGQKPHASELAPTSDSAGDSSSALEKFHIQDAVGTKASSSNAGKDLPAETEVELTKKSDDMELVKEETVELTGGTSGDQVEKQSDMKHVLLQHCAAEVDSINNNTADLLSLCRFTKVPTKTRSSLTTRGLKVDLVPVSEEEEDCETGQVQNDCDMGPPMGSEVPIRNVSGDSYSADASSNQIQSETCPDSGVVMEAPVMSEENSGDLDPLYVEQGKCMRSQSFAERSFVNEQESSERTPGFGRCSSMMMERGLKRASQHSDSRDRTKKPREWLPPLMTQRDDFLHLSNLRGNQPASQEGRRSPGGEVFSATDEEGPVDMSMFQRCDAGPCTEYAEEKQLFPASFKICDLNLMESSEVNEIPDPNSILQYPSIPESDKDKTPVDVDLSISNGSNMSGKYGADGREVEVIDLENDAVQEHKDFNNCERKAETLFSGLESLTNHAQSANDISDAQDGYGLMISELLGADISNCSSVPADINSLHNEMTIHNGEGILGDDEAIYMSLGEIPISMPEI